MGAVFRRSLESAVPLAEPGVVRRLESRQPMAYLVASVRGVGQVDLQPNTVAFGPELYVKPC